jgi:hypothetical protein
MTPLASRGSSAWRNQTWGTPCDKKKIVELSFCGVRLWVHRTAVPAFQAMETVILFFGYTVRKRDTGSYNCRVIKGTATSSAHSWGIAIDINWESNPWLTKLVTDLPRAMVDAICAIKTAGGIQVWRWGGDWDGRPDTPHNKYDAMHFELVCTPAELTAGPLKVPDLIRDVVPVFRPVLKLGCTGEHVTELQKLLGVVGPDTFGPKTFAAVVAFQRKHNLTDDGVVGPRTWELLIQRK